MFLFCWPWEFFVKSAYATIAASFCVLFVETKIGAQSPFSFALSPPALFSISAVPGNYVITHLTARGAERTLIQSATAVISLATPSNVQYKRLRGALLMRSSARRARRRSVRLFVNNRPGTTKKHFLDISCQGKTPVDLVQ